MNFHSDKWIMDRVREHYEEAKTLVPEERIVGIFYQGSGNYGLDCEDSDVDTKLIITPSLREVALNRPAVSTTHVRENNEHIDIKDVRVMLQTFKKQNINFLEILFTPYKIMPNSKISQIWTKLEERAEDIAHYDPIRFYKTIAGMSKAKYEALEHPYPSRAHLIEKYGYDGKQLCHLMRFNQVFHEYRDGRPFKDCLRVSNPEYLKMVKNQIYSLDEARYWADLVYHSTEKKCANLINNSTNIKPNEEISKMLEEVQYEIIKASFIEEVNKNN